jgi:hypothetical protein
VAGFGAITEPDQLGPTLDKPIEFDESGKTTIV